MKRQIAVASLALLAVAALATPANAQSCSQQGPNRGFQGRGNAGWNNSDGGFGFNTNANYGGNFANGYGNRYNNGYQYGNAFNRFGNIDNAQARLQSRITAGINSGRLTQAESARLQAKFAQIASMEANLRASGNRLSFGERQRLTNQLARLSSDVTRQMNDFDGRVANNGRYGWNRY
ncbi:MAG: hypothetical protein K2W95_12555 [Candidatus Obscuribacterales bacterium]|nr:hypothetical protein [Candidatus Obscuribacterales bacterium]